MYLLLMADSETTLFSDTEYDEMLYQCMQFDGIIPFHVLAVFDTKQLYLSSSIFDHVKLAKS